MKLDYRKESTPRSNNLTITSNTIQGQDSALLIFQQNRGCINIHCSRKALDKMGLIHYSLMYRPDCKEQMEEGAYVPVAEFP